MEKFREVLNLHLKHRNALGYCLVSLLTAGGERIFSTTVFQSPCSVACNLPYGLVFLLVPALALFLLGYVLSARTWRLLTGCCVLGWVLIAVVIILLLICTSITRCLSPVSYLQLKFWKIYLQQEQQILKSQATEHATQLAKENIKCFFECSHPQEYNTPSIKDWQQISSLYTFNPKEQYYSTLHKYVNKKQKNQSSTSSEEDAMVPVLGFVDSSDMNSTTDL
ncbi:PREDICTED: protein FAM26F [Bison bison bison]|uniref:Protein FAM26F n=1 Tax=Bison bison bison TaxID=43346 RepID=A0A6P3J8I4_BISBB|nr:PREDICTED: protein FAM26F [Bison bison bison]